MSHPIRVPTLASDTLRPPTCTRHGALLRLTLLTTALLSACGGSSGGGITPTTYTATCGDGSIKTSTISQAVAQSMCVPTDSSNGWASILATAPADPGYVELKKRFTTNSTKPEAIVVLAT